MSAPTTDMEVRHLHVSINVHLPQFLSGKIKKKNQIGATGANMTNQHVAQT